MHKQEADKNMSESMISEDASNVSFFLGLSNSKMKIKTIILTRFCSKSIRIDFLLEIRFTKWEYKITIYFDKHTTYFGTLPSK